VLLGGGAEAALRRAGRVADGWISAGGADLRHLDVPIATVKQAAREAGRDPDTLRFVCRGPVAAVRRAQETLAALAPTGA
jgi:alkanesulfonate monooxygenase SsuD/methylene tetrahydromethanopterin reductase-like flavin-dependent oxidoreductase (luciferase family)